MLVRLHGTFRAVHQDQFVRGVNLKIVREKDNATRKFEWTFFNVGLQTIATLDGSQNRSIENPAGIMIVPAQPYRFDITFSDPEFLESEINPRINEVRKEWVESSSQYLQTWSAAHSQFSGYTSDQAFEDLYARFSKDEIYQRVTADLFRLCFWDAGRYYLTMEVITETPRRSFGKEWQFELSSNDAASLRNNTNIMISQTIRKPGQHSDYWANIRLLPPAV